RDSLELDIDIEEGKVEVLAKRRRKTSNLDLSTQVCEEIDQLAGTAGRTTALQQIKANFAGKKTGNTVGKKSKALIKPKVKPPPATRASKRGKSKVVELESESGSEAERAATATITDTFLER
ncbi:hypothetical protein IFR05_017630, partial [Cadophora sp. M221]